MNYDPKAIGSSPSNNRGNRNKESYNQNKDWNKKRKSTITKVDSRLFSDNNTKDKSITKMKEFETYIFDLDGTLLETLRDLAASTNYALRTHNMPEHSIENVRMFVGNGVKKLMERAIPNGISNPQFEEVYATFRQHYLEHSLDTTKPYEGIPEMLTELKARGKKPRYCKQQVLCCYARTC